MSKNFLYEYLNAFAPVAQETMGQEIWENYVTEYADQMITDAYGSKIGVKLAADPNKSAKKVIIEAHCDEIAWIVTSIDESGMLRVKRHGGSDNMIAPSKTVVIHTHDGEQLRGVFGWPAIHTRKTAVEKGYDQHELWVDLGLKDKDTVIDAGVEVGNLITYDTPFEEIGDYYVGRSLDNKIGGYIIAEVLKELHGKDLPYTLYVVNAVQEEVGLHGAKMVAKRLQGDLAIVHDVCHNTDTPKMDKAKDGDVKGGDGPCVEYTAQNHRGVIKMLRETANDMKIPMQLAVGSYGNDTMAYFLENTPTAILATPLKYMHTTVEMAHKEDVANVIKLYVEVLSNLTDEKIYQLNQNNK